MHFYEQVRPMGNSVSASASFYRRSNENGSLSALPSRTPTSHSIMSEGSGGRVKNVKRKRRQTQQGGPTSTVTTNQTRFINFAEGGLSCRSCCCCLETLAPAFGYGIKFGRQLANTAQPVGRLFKVVCVRHPTSQAVFQFSERRCSLRTIRACVLKTFLHQRDHRHTIQACCSPARFLTELGLFQRRVVGVAVVSLAVDTCVVPHC